MYVWGLSDGIFCLIPATFQTPLCSITPPHIIFLQSPNASSRISLSAHLIRVGLCHTSHAVCPVWMLTSKNKSAIDKSMLPPRGLASELCEGVQNGAQNGAHRATRPKARGQPKMLEPRSFLEGTFCMYPLSLCRMQVSGLSNPCK